MAQNNCWQLVQALLEASEKSATIARHIRNQQVLFDLLVEEKTGACKNSRFCQDFKTLADVLIQTTLQHDLGKKFPDISKHIFGEESNHFQNALGESIDVKVEETAELTAKLLEKVLDGNDVAANLLASSVHSDIALEKDDDIQMLDGISLPLDELGIWIDPIDSTYEYMCGKEATDATEGVSAHGLHCVTILIGVFHMKSGEPVVGIINQPFGHQNADKQWTGRRFWGVNWQNRKHASSTLQSKTTPRSGKMKIIMSASEAASVKKTLTTDSSIVCYSAGAGYKLLCVAEGLVDCYIITKDSTYKWDTCAPHAILKSLGGAVIGCSALTVEGVKTELTYSSSQPPASDTSISSTGIERFCNVGGFIASRDPAIIDTVWSLLKSK